MAHILILGGGAAGLAAALAAAQTDPTARVTVLERSPRPGKKLLATGNGRCNLDNEGITPESYSSADRAALDAYQQHPYHVDVVKAHMHAVRSASVSVDWEV